MKRFDAAVLIGRFQPFHNEHLRLLRRALSLAPMVVVVLGSAFHAPTPRNPFGWRQRMEMILASLTPAERARVRFAPVRDYNDDARWVAAVSAGVAAAAGEGAAIALVGHFKDASSYYLSRFPAWTLVEEPEVARLDATPIREALLSPRAAAARRARERVVREGVLLPCVAGLLLVMAAGLWPLRPAPAAALLGASLLTLAAAAWMARRRPRRLLSLTAALQADGVAAAVVRARRDLPAGAADHVDRWTQTAAYDRLLAEHEQLRAYQKAWEPAPYAPIFVTVDAVVRAGNRVLLIRRGGYPGKGLWALPGGFVEPAETLLVSALRELEEETTLGVGRDALLAALKDQDVFDHPARSERGRTVTHAYYFDLGDAVPPAIAAADDAAAARWVPIDELAGMEDQFLDDHFLILDRFLDLQPAVGLAVAA